MKIKCDVICDLLPLYEEKISSEASNKLVEEHLKECEKCRKFLTGMESDIQLEKMRTSNEAEQSAVKKCFRKVKFRVAAVALIFVLITGTATFTILNQYYKAGMNTSNLDEIQLAMEYVNCIAEGKYEEAAEMMEPAFKIEYLDVKGYVYGMYEVMDLRHGNVSNMTQEEYCQFRKNQFIERMNKWDDHTKITGISFVRADADVNSWDISIEVEQESLTEDERWKSTLIFEVYSKTGYISCEGKKGPEQWWDVFEWMDVMDIYHK